MQILIAHINSFALIDTIVRNSLTHCVDIVNLNSVSVTLVLLLFLIIERHYGAPLHLFILQNVLQMFIVLLISIWGVLLLSYLSGNKTGIFILIGDSDIDMLVIILFNYFSRSLIESVVIVHATLFNTSITCSFEV